MWQTVDEKRLKCSRVCLPSLFFLPDVLWSAVCIHKEYTLNLNFIIELKFIVVLKKQMAPVAWTFMRMLLENATVEQMKEAYLNTSCFSSCQALGHRAQSYRHFCYVETLYLMLWLYWKKKNLVILQHFFPQCCLGSDKLITIFKGDYTQGWHAVPGKFYDILLLLLVPDCT